MAINKTLYIKDEDIPVWEKATSLMEDGSLSQFLTNHLKSFVASKEAESTGFKKIILQFREGGKFPRAKAFYGRWLISPEKPFNKADGEFGPFEPYSLAITSKNNIVVFEFMDEPYEDGKFDWGRMRVFPSFESAGEAEDIPSGLIAAAMEQMGVEVEELDI